MNDKSFYLKSFYENEKDANRHMSLALVFSAVLLLIVWVCYLAGVFSVAKTTLAILNVAIPINVLILIVPVFMIKSPMSEKPWFKYFVSLLLIAVITVLNIVMPKHVVLGWALCIFVTNHYYNPRMCKINYAIVLVMMLVAMYGGMFLGEFDAHLLTGELNEAEGMIYNYRFTTPYPDTVTGRFNYLHDLLQIGVNRYFSIFIFYYLGRAGLITIIFYASKRLNIRTNKLFLDEIAGNAEKEKAAVELDIAKSIQLQTVPNEFVLNEEIEIQAELKAAKVVGGDFYDYFKLDSDHVAIVIGDVSGKGIPAAMFMMKTITCFKNYASIDLSPSETLKKVNKKIYDGNESNMFVTCLYAIINTKTGLVRFSNAGHNPPIVGQKQHFSFLQCKSGFVLGALSDAIVTDEEYTLRNGDLITLYTDGITEAKNEKGEFFGEKRLLDVFNAKEYSCLLDIHHSLKDDVLAFCGDEDQSDDITYITLKYHGEKYVYESMKISSQKENVQKLLDFLEEFSIKNNLDRHFTNNLLVVGDELLSNIVKFGYPDNPGEIYIRALYNLDKEEFALIIVDHGVPFDPFSIDNKPLDGDFMNRAEGGLGILIVKKLMDEYAYDNINGKNIITLKKRMNK